MTWATTARTTSSLSSAHAAGTKWRSFNLRIVNVIRASTKVDERPRPRRDGRFKAGVNFAGVKEVPNFLNHLTERSAFTVMQGCTYIRDASFGFASASICIVVQNPWQRAFGLREYASVITASGERNHFFKLLRSTDEKIERITRLREQQIHYVECFRC